MMELISDSSHTGFYTRQIFLPHQFGVSDNWTNPGISNLSEVRAKGLLNLGKKHLNHQNWENLMHSKRTGLSFLMD